MKKLLGAIILFYFFVTNNLHADFVDQLNKLTDIDSEDPQVVEAIQQAKMGMMELELAILEMEKTPENVEALRSTLNELTEGFEDQDEST